MRLTLAACLLLASSAAALPPHPEDAPLRAITFADAREGWAVGDDGVIWHTVDAGKNWERQASGTRASLRAVQFLTPYTGFAAGRTELPNRAGSQGVLLSTADGGVTWTTVTETLLPGLNAVQFFDDKRGVVAGDGSDAFPSGVFRTEDGGRTWAMLPGPRSTTWTGLSFTTLDTGKLFDSGRGREVADGRVTTSSAPLTNQWTLGLAKDMPNPLVHDRLEVPHAGGPIWHVGEFGAITTRQAGGWSVQRCGGRRASVLFAFKRSRDVPLGALAALAAEGYLCTAVANDADADHCLATAVRLVGGAGGLKGDLATAHFLDPEVIVTDLPIAEVRKVAKVYAPAAGPGDGVVSLNLTAYVPELGGSPRDTAEPAALLFGPTPQPDSLHFKLVGGTLADAKNHTSLMEGVHLAERGEARRPKPAPADPARETVAAARRELEKQLAGPLTGDAVKAVVAKLKTLPEADAARAGTMLGFRLAHAGQWTAARELFACVAEQYPAYPEAVEAIRWLVRFHTSGEARRRVELGHFPAVRPAGFAEEPADPVRQASHTAELTASPMWRFRAPDDARGWLRTAADLRPKLAAFGAAYARDPANAFCLATAHRSVGLPARAADQFASLAATCGEPWAGRLGEELRLAGVPGDHPRGPELTCRFVRAKPFLDGKLDDPCWTDAGTVKLADGTARLACDDQFLYVGVECKGVATGDKLTRDGDVFGRDRVEIALDVDRDYTTAYRIAVDAAGSVADDCWGDRGWNPKLFVATAKTGDGWAVELAVPLSELTGAKPMPGQPWAAGVARRKAGEAEPAALGVLRFVAVR